MLKRETWHLLARLGEGGFDSPAAAGAFVILLTLSRGKTVGNPNELFATATRHNMMHCLDVSDSRTAAKKSTRLLTEELTALAQERQLANPDSIISLVADNRLPLMSEFGHCHQGTSTGDNIRFVRLFWEHSTHPGDRQRFQDAPEQTGLHCGKQKVIDWTGVKCFTGSAVRGEHAWWRRGVAIGQMRSLPATVFNGDYFSNSTPVIVPFEQSDLAALWCYCSSDEFSATLRAMNQKLSVDNGYVSKMPIDIERWRKHAAQHFPAGLPKAYSDDPTQWIFHGHPCGSVVWDDKLKGNAHGSLRTDSSVLQVGVARLLGYRWPAEQDSEMELADEQREWVRRCEELSGLGDEDGIVCISPVRGEASAGERLLSYLAASFGDAWNDGVLARLLAEVGVRTLDDWLRHRFFEQHCKLFQDRPFVWHIWDGRRDGFHALVNYHMLAAGDGRGRQLLETLSYSYLGDWINRQGDGVTRCDGGAEGRLEAALELQKRLVAIRDGEPPFDTFVRWKPIDQHPIGWEPDINDGVRLNIRPFMAEDIPGGRRGAGILRSKPNIHWRKDRGREPSREADQFPWFWNNGDFTGDRVNDVHLSLAQKRDVQNAMEAHR